MPNHNYAALDDVKYPGVRFYLIHKGLDERGTYTYLQLEMECLDTDTGRHAFHKSRKWLLSEHMTRSEVVQTALKAVLTVLEHEARENFKYRGAAIFGPHFDVDALSDVCAGEMRNIRKEVRKEVANG